MKQYLTLLKQANAKDLNTCIKVLISNGLNTPDHVSLIIEIIGLYLRYMLIPRLKVTELRTYVSKLCEAVLFPPEVTINCLYKMQDLGILEVNEGEDFVKWIGPEPNEESGDAYLNSLNMIVMDAILKQSREGTLN